MTDKKAAKDMTTTELSDEWRDLRREYTKAQPEDDTRELMNRIMDLTAELEHRDQI